MADNRSIAADAARRYGVPTNVFLAQMGQEAGFQTGLTSRAGARGPAQIMPGTARAWGVRNVNDPHEAYDAAARHMKQYIDKYGIRGALRAYNAGEGGMNKGYAETTDYERRIMAAAGNVTEPPRGRTASRPGANITPATPGTPAMVDKQGAVLGALTGRRRGESLTHAIIGNLQSGQYMTPGTPGTPASVQGGGGAISGEGAPGSVQDMIAEANRIDAAKMPYKWGGGHAKKLIRGRDLTPLDCSGAVSQILGINPRVSGAFVKWGQPGRGKNVTIYANSTHVFMEIDGHFWGTSRSNPAGGAGWIPAGNVNVSGFTARHPAGM